ncbi:hypothetical protein RYX36_034119 [Vicia faba]
MWFLLNPPGKATVHIQNIDNFDWLSMYNTFKKQNASDPRYISELNYLRFYLPDIFPTLNKILLFDHDVVVQQDLSTLWNINMNEKVIAGVGTCQEGETSFRRMDMFINFSNPYIAKRFDLNACTWAFRMNLFDLQQWRRHNLTGVHHKYLQKAHRVFSFEATLDQYKKKLKELKPSQEDAISMQNGSDSSVPDVGNLEQTQALVASLKAGLRFS